MGITNDKQIKNIDNPQVITEKITDMIDKFITPKIIYAITPHTEDGKTYLELSIQPGSSTPYYYQHNGNIIAFIRMGSSTIESPDYVLNELILKGTGKTYDGVLTGYKKDDFSFSILESDFLEKTGTRFTNQDYISFNLMNKDGYLTNCGVLLADSNNYRQSRIFCTKWNGIDKVNEQEVDDDKEFSGSLIRQLKLALDFFKTHTAIKWHKSKDKTIYEPDYSDEAILEALVNALIHRNYNNLGAEVCLNIYDNRIEITSPGIMVSGDPIPKYVDYPFESMRRNPFLADVFWKMGYMNRRGSGLAKITNSTSKLFDDEKEHVSYQIRNSFFVVTIDNANYISNKFAKLTERQKSIIKCISKGNNAVGTIAKELNVDRKTIRKDLEKLEETEIIKSQGSTKNKIWFIK